MVTDWGLRLNLLSELGPVVKLWCWNPGAVRVQDWECGELLYLFEGEVVGGGEHHHCVVHGVLLLLLWLERLYIHRLTDREADQYLVLQTDQLSITSDSHQTLTPGDTVRLS